MDEVLNQKRRRRKRRMRGIHVDPKSWGGAIDFLSKVSKNQEKALELREREEV